MSDVQDIYAAPDALVTDTTATGSDELLTAAIGPKNSDYYINFFKRSGGKDWVASWNWPAFLVTSLWLLYRKLWLGFLLYVFVLPMMLALVMGVAGAVAGETVGMVVYLIGVCALAFGFPVYANAMYMSKLRSLIRKAEQQAADRAGQLSYLARHGGTSWIWILLSVIPIPAAW